VVVPEIALQSASISDLQGNLPWEEIRARLTARGASMTSAKLSMTDVSSQSVDGYELLRKLTVYEGGGIYVIPSYREGLGAFASAPAQGAPAMITMRAISEVYLARGIDAELVFDGSTNAGAGAEVASLDRGIVRVDVSSVWANGFAAKVHKDFTSPVPVGVRGYTLTVDLQDWSVRVDPDVSRGAGSGGIIPAAD
jgi:hypothetical protein